MGEIYRDVVTGQFIRIGDRGSDILLCSDDGPPRSGATGTGVGVLGKGSIFIDRVTGFWYKNAGTLDAPNWKDMTGTARKIETVDTAAAFTTALADPTVDTIMLDGDISDHNDALTINRDLTLDLNGHTLGGDDNLLVTGNGVVVTIRNGMLAKEPWIRSAIYSEAIQIRGGATLVGSNLDISCARSGDVQNIGICLWDASSLYLTNSRITAISDDTAGVSRNAQAVFAHEGADTVLLKDNVFALSVAHPERLRVVLGSQSTTGVADFPTNVTIESNEVVHSDPHGYDMAMLLYAPDAPHADIQGYAEGIVVVGDVIRSQEGVTNAHRAYFERTSSDWDQVDPVFSAITNFAAADGILESICTFTALGASAQGHIWYRIANSGEDYIEGVAVTGAVDTITQTGLEEGEYELKLVIDVETDTALNVGHTNANKATITTS